MTKYVPNFLTLTRLIMALLLVNTLHTYFHGEHSNPRFTGIMALFALICLSDLADGRTARSLKSESRSGAVFDVLADLFYIISSMAVLNGAGLIPIWFTAAVLLKFMEFTLTSGILRKRLKAEGVFIPDPAGRLAAAVFFLVPGLVCLLQRLCTERLCTFDFTIAVNMVLSAVVLLSLVSSVIRCLGCRRIIAGSKERLPA